MNLNLDNLIEVISKANESERNIEQQQAENQLKAWETVTGYHYLLQDIYLRQDLPLQIRWLAVICFKNGVEKYWRPSKTNAIDRNEKNQIRRRLFSLVNEKNNQLMIQNAYSTARVARFDFPSEWPQLFEEFKHFLEGSCFQENDLVATNNFLLILNQTIKSLSAIRIGRSRLALQAKASIIVPLLIKMYMKYYHEWTTTLDLSTMEVCFQCLKNLRRIIPEAYEQPHKSEDLVEFLQASENHLKSLISEHEKYSSDLLERYVKCYSKIYYNIIISNPTSFVLLPCSKDIIYTFFALLDQKASDIYNSSEENDFWETLALKGFGILKRIIAYIYKKGALTLKQKSDRDDVKRAIDVLRSDFFTPQVIMRLSDLIIRWYLKLRPSDLENWNFEPEEWCNEELSSSWEFQIRPCAENFFQDLITFFKDDISEYVLKEISENLAGIDSTNDVLLSDAFLCAFQLSSISIADSVDFEALLINKLIPEALKTDITERKILRRRVCLIIAEWVSVKCLPSTRIAIYKFIVALLRSSDNLNDKVIKLTAIQTLRTMIDDWDFDKHDFEPFLEDIVSLSLSILSDFSLTESKLYVLNTLTSLFEKCIPLVDKKEILSVVSIIAPYWNSNDAENESILKTSLLRLLKTLLKCLDFDSFRTYSLTLPLITACCSPNTTMFSLLNEDGYELWLTTLQYSPVSNSEQNSLIELFPLLQDGISSSTETLPTILSIMRSYALINPQIYQTEVAFYNFKTLAGYLPMLREDSFTVFYALMDILLLSLPGDEVFIKTLVTSGLFQAMALFAVDDSQYVTSVNKIYMLLSRLMFNSTEAFFDILQESSFDSERLMTSWMEHLKSTSIVRNKKMNLIALLAASRFAIPRKANIFVRQFPLLIKTVLLYIEEINEDKQGNCSIYTNDLPYDDIDDHRYLDQNIPYNGEKLRYESLLESRDPIFCVNIRSTLYETMSSLEKSLTQDDFSQLISMLDQYSLEKIQT